MQFHSNRMFIPFRSNRMFIPFRFNRMFIPLNSAFGSLDSQGLAGIGIQFHSNPIWFQIPDYPLKSNSQLFLVKNRDYSITIFNPRILQANPSRHLIYILLCAGAGETIERCITMV